MAYMDAYGLLYDTGCTYNLFSYNGSDWVCPGEGCLFPSGLPLSNTCLCKASIQQQNANKVSIYDSECIGIVKRLRTCHNRGYREAPWSSHPLKWCWNPMWKKRQRDTRICYKMENTFHYTMKTFATHRRNPWEIHSFMTTRHPIKSQ